jgi:hypothetical protein
MNFDHSLQQRVIRVDYVVAQKHGKRVVANVLLASENRVAETLWVSLTRVVNVG